MNEDDLFFAYRQQIIRKGGSVMTNRKRERCVIGSCPTMIDVSAQRFVCLYHKRKAEEERLAAQPINQPDDEVR